MPAENQKNSHEGAFFLDEWPLFFPANLIKGDPYNSIGICTLWAPVKKILSELHEKDYCIAGSLYSRDGINYILRNVLANPHIRCIIVCGPDRSGSGEALFKLWQNGIDENHQIIGDLGKIEKEIEKWAIDLCRENVKLIDLRNIIDPTKIRKTVHNTSAMLPPFASQPIKFLKSDPQSDTYPSEGNGFVIRAHTVVEGWVKLLSIITKFGRREKTEYSVFQKELLNVISVISAEDPDHILFVDWLPFPRERLEGKHGNKLNHQTIAQMFLPGVNANESFGYYAHLLTHSPVRDFAYTYGQRLYAYGERLTGFRGVDQIRLMIEKLRSVKYTRRAVAVLWEPDYDADSENPPCLDLIQVDIREELLSLTAYFRSQDMFRAWPENAFALRKLQKFIADSVGIHSIGDLVIVSHSAHIYEDSLQNAADVVENQGEKLRKKLSLSSDPRGNFVIRIEGKEIIVDLHSPDGNHIKTFRGQSSRQLEREISPFISKISHALYLGRELQKAEICSRQKTPYIQDRDVFK